MSLFHLNKYHGVFICFKVLIGWGILIKQFLKLVKQFIKLLSGKSAFIICWQSKLIRRKLLQVCTTVTSIKALKQFWPMKCVSPKAFGTLLGITLLIDTTLITINNSPIGNCSINKFVNPVRSLYHLVPSALMKSSYVLSAQLILLTELSVLQKARKTVRFLILRTFGDPVTLLVTLLTVQWLVCVKAVLTYIKKFILTQSVYTMIVQCSFVIL